MNCAAQMWLQELDDSRQRDFALVEDIGEQLFDKGTKDIVCYQHRHAHGCVLFSQSHLPAFALGDIGCLHGDTGASLQYLQRLADSEVADGGAGNKRQSRP